MLDPRACHWPSEHRVKGPFVTTSVTIGRKVSRFNRHISLAGQRALVPTAGRHCPARPDLIASNDRRGGPDQWHRRPQRRQKEPEPESALGNPLATHISSFSSPAPNAMCRPSGLI